MPGPDPTPTGGWPGYLIVALATAVVLLAGAVAYFAWTRS